MVTYFAEGHTEVCWEATFSKGEGGKTMICVVCVDYCSVNIYLPSFISRYHVMKLNLELGGDGGSGLSGVSR